MSSKQNRNLLILCSQRTGSTYFASMLHSYAQAINPSVKYLSEFFNREAISSCRYVVDGQRRFSVDPVPGGHYKDYILDCGEIVGVKRNSSNEMLSSERGYRMDLINRSASPTIIKHHADDQIDQLICGIDNLTFVFLERANKLMQFLSYGKAISTGVWFKTNPGKSISIARNSITLTRNDYEKLHRTLVQYEEMKSKYPGEVYVYEDVIGGEFDPSHRLAGLFEAATVSHGGYSSPFIRTGSDSIDEELSLFSNAEEVVGWISQDFHESSC